MKSALILAAAAGALAQNLSGMPSCAVPCITSAVTAAGCAPTDVACQCGPTQSAISSLAQTCVLTACPATAIASVVQAGNALCAQASQTGSGSAVTTLTRSASTTGSSSGSSSSSGSGIPSGATIIATVPASNGTFTTPAPSTTGGSSSGGSSSSGSAGGASKPSGSSSTSSPNAAATPVALGAGALIGLLGVVAAL